MATNPENIEAQLKSIRDVVDRDVTGCDIDTILEHGKKLSALMGLSCECMASAQKTLQIARRKAINALAEKNYGASVLLKLADGECGIELATYEYSERLNATITHQLDFYRTLISLHKSELENSMK
jgi:hypothetical protein